MKRVTALLNFLFFINIAFAADRFVVFQQSPDYFPVISNGVPCSILTDSNEEKGIQMAIKNLQKDIAQVSGNRPEILNISNGDRQTIIIGSNESPFIKALFKTGKLEKEELNGKKEKYIIRTIDKPLEGIDRALVIAGSDKRGTIYGIYELSEQIGVSPWYWWADVPVVKQKNVYVIPGSYTDGEPAVTYRGIFLNDEAPCLTGWVKQTYGTNYGDHRFYARIFELILRLKGNLVWPAMWAWAFYADDPLNSKTADEMGIIIGT